MDAVRVSDDVVKIASLIGLKLLQRASQPANLGAFANVS